MKSKQLAVKARELQTAETAEALWHLAKTNAYKVNLLIQNPPYEIFTVKKRNGTPRIIEDPCDELKLIQDNLNDYLQPLYYFYRTDAAYGYIIKPDDDDEETRNIVTAARKHCAHDYLLNIDIRDFFHYVSWQNVYRSITAMPFDVYGKAAESICHLCTYNGRLPMGAPTSPALSNIAAYEIDKEIQNYCNGEGLTYTRYVDDISFSSNTVITERHFMQLSGIVNRFGYPLREEKIKWFKPGEVKTITGLSIKNNIVCIPENYMLQVADEINNLKAFVLMQTRLYPKKPLAAAIAKPVQKIKGAFAFIEAVHGKEHETLNNLQLQLEKAIDPPADYESLNWLEIGYKF